jgi:hypothetical protein
MVNVKKLISYDLISSPSFREAKLIDQKKIEREKRIKLQKLRKKKIKNII